MAIQTDVKIGDSKQDGLLNTTQVSDQVKVTQRAIIDGAQAWRVFSEIEKANQERNTTDAVIWNKYNDGQPFDPKALADAGQSNRYNFPTGFMSSIVDRVTPVPIAIIDSARYLTSASLCNTDYTKGEYDPKTGQPPVDPTKGSKTGILREKVTKYIRRWPDWKTFCTGLCQELVLIGRCFAVFLDPYTPWPKFFRTDQAFLPNGTGEHARTVQFLVAKQDLLVHELVNFIRNKDAAQAAGWDIANTVMAINAALPINLTQEGSQPANQRTYEDCIREGNRGASYAGASVIKIAHVLAVEATDTIGKDNPVTHFILYRDKNHEVLFKKEDRFDKVDDALTLFTLEPGNGKFYGSKGLGRKLINKHLAIERARNRMFDQLEMSGLMILHADAARAPQVQFKVRHPFILTTTDAQFVDQEISANVKAYLDADAKMMDLAQQRVGQYLPNQLTNNEGMRDKTAKEVTVDYQREAEAKVAFLSRFWGQFADLVSAIQRKLLDPQTTDKAAKELQAELINAGITKEEMQEFANAPAAEVIQDLTQIQNQQILMVSQAYANDPDINTRELKIRTISAMASPAIAEALVLPPKDVTANILESAREQMLETEAMNMGSPGMPVSPRDNHKTHLDVIIPDLLKAVSSASQVGIAPDGLGKLAAGLTHAQAHLQAWQQAGGDAKTLKPYIEGLKQVDVILKKLSVKTAQGMAQQQDQQAQAQGQAQQAQQNPVSPDVMKVLVSLYPNTVGSIKRQIEQILGLQPADPNEADVEAAKEAVYKHPDLPEKIADKAVTQAAPQLPQQGIPAPPGGVQPTPEPPTPDSPNAV
jgi:hypothetical protein